MIVEIMLAVSVFTGLYVTVINPGFLCFQASLIMIIFSGFFLYILGCMVAIIFPMSSGLRVWYGSGFMSN